MEYKRLFIWVEGSDDERLFNTIKERMFADKYDWVEVRQYQKIKAGKVSSFIKSIKAMNAEYIFTADINSKPCVTAKKEEIQGTYGNIDDDRIMVVIVEIEGWYLAGLGDASSQKLEIPPFGNTDSVTKEQFNTLIPKNFDIRRDFMSEILKYFSIDTAKEKNRSFKYFAEKYN